MQLDHVHIESEAVRLLPDLIDELFQSEGEPLHFIDARDRGIDLLAKGRGQKWIFEVKVSSRPGLVSTAAEQLESFGDGLKVLVVPFMTAAGAKAANAHRLNWIDLSGNAHIRSDRFYVYVKGKPNRFVQRGRPSSPFAPKSARITRLMLLDPSRWWRRQEIASETSLNSSQVSRVVGRLREERLLEERPREERLLEVRPRDPAALLDAWEEEYKFSRHRIVRGHISGTGVELARELTERLGKAGEAHAFTGLAAAWAFDGFARFRLNSVYIHGNPHEVAEKVGLRLDERGANVQLIAPDDAGVFSGSRRVEGLECVSPVQAYLDLGHLPERASEAAANLRAGGLWNGS